MTSSLVGSEMCIRDSAWAGWQSRRRRSFAPVRGKGWRLWGESGRLRCSVSYTHLTLPTICSV
eukprot:5142652-Prorocentrum_lima.AAC.1